MTKLSRIGLVLIRILFWALGILFTLFVALTIIVQLPAVHRLLLKKGEEYFHAKTGGYVHIEQIDLRLPGYLALSGISLSKPDSSSFVSLEEVKISLGWRKLLDKQVVVDRIFLGGLIGSVWEEVDSVWNYQWIVDGFSSPVTASIDTSQSSWGIQIGLVQLEKIDFKYGSNISLDSLHLKLQALTLLGENLSITDNTYLVDELDINGTSFYYRIGKAGPEEDDSTASTNPFTIKTGINQLHLNEINLRIEMQDKSYYAVGLYELEALTEIVDVSEGIYHFESIAINSLNFNGRSMTESEEEDETAVDFFVPMDIQVQNLDLAAINVLYGDPQAPTVDISNLMLNGSNILANRDSYAATISINGGTYGSYTLPDEFHTSVKLTPTEAEINELTFKNGDSNFKLVAHAGFDNIQSTLQTFAFNTVKTNLELDLARFEDLDFVNAFYQMDSVRHYFPDDFIRIKLEAISDGRIINLRKFDLRSGETSLLASGSTGIKVDDRLVLNDFDLKFNKADWNSLFRYYQLDSLRIPSQFEILANGSYNSQALEAKVNFKSEMGDIVIKAHGEKSETGKLATQISIQTDTLLLSQFVDPKTNIRAKLNLNSDLDDLYNPLANLSFDGGLEYVQYGVTELQEITFLGAMTDPDYHVSVFFADSSLLAQVHASGTTEPGFEIQVDSQIDGVDFRRMKISNRDLRMAFCLEAQFKTDSSSTGLNAGITELILVSNNDRYDIHPISINFNNQPDSTQVKIESTMVNLNGEMKGNFDKIQELWFNLVAGQTEETAANPAYLKLDFEVKDVPGVRELLLPDLTRLEPGFGHILLDESSQTYEALVQLGGLTYGSFSIDSLKLFADPTNNGVAFNFGIRRAAYDTLALENIKMSALRSKNNSAISLSIDNPYTSTLDLIMVANLGRDENTPGKLTFLQFDTLNFAENNWITNQTNTTWNFDSPTNNLAFETTDGQQSVTILSEPNSFKVKLVKFDLAQLGQLFANPKNPLAGNVSGIVNSLPEGELETHGNMSDVELVQIAFGNINWQIQSEKNYLFAEFRVDGEDLDFESSGSMTIKDGIENIDFSGKINDLNLSALEHMPGGYFTESSGNANGEFSIIGATSSPEVYVNLNFNEALLKSGFNGERYTLNNETISLSEGKIQFNDFTVIDESKQKLEINGSINIGKSDFGKADLVISGKNFTLLNLSKKESPGLFGKFLVDADISVKGALDAPEIDSKIRIAESTDLSYLVQSDSDIETIDDELLVWVEMDNTSDSVSNILLRKVKESLNTSVFQNTIDFRSALEIDKNAQFTIVIDTITGDFLQIKGGGKLAVKYDRAGNLNLNGTYQVNEGFYQLTLYDIIKKKFDISKGSVVTWNGDVMDATLNIKALYHTKASVKNLLSSSEENVAALNQQLPFEINMNIDGDLNQPLISFNIQLDESSKGALGGSVEARLKQINDDENERNKQVVALLLFNTFLTTDGSGNDNLAANQARNSASGLLTDQLNALSGKYLKNVDLNFDLQSYGGNAGEGNTDLNVELAKTFLDDRMVVHVGSTIALESSTYNSSNNNFMTNVEIEYKLTPDGRYRFKVYSKTDLEDIVVGRITRTGAGIVFRRDFDQWRHLLKNPEQPDTVRANPTDTINKVVAPNSQP